MADIADVETAIAELVAAAVYPNGTSAASVAGIAVRVHRGWPQPDELDQDLNAGRARISVFAQPGHTRNTTRYPQTYRYAAPGVPTITATLSSNGLVVTFGGTIAVGQNVGVLCAGVGYIVPVQPLNTLTDIATGLAAQIPDAGSNGPVLTLPTPGVVTIAVQVGAMQELRRQEQGVMVTCWCPTPSARDVLAATVDAAMAAISFIALPDQQARIRYTDTRIYDTAENALLYRRDLFYLVEFATVGNSVASPLIFPLGNLTDAIGDIVAF